MNIGSKLRALRADRNLTTPEVASMAGVTQSTISELENDKRSPSLNTLEKICDALKVPIMEVLPIEHHIDFLGYSLTKEEHKIISYLHSLSIEERELWFTANDIFHKMTTKEKKRFIATNGHSFSKEEKELIEFYGRMIPEERKNFYSLLKSLLLNRKN